MPFEEDYLKKLDEAIDKMAKNTTMWKKVKTQPGYFYDEVVLEPMPATFDLEEVIEDVVEPIGPPRPSVGDIVELDPGSKYALEGTETNPLNVLGEVEKVDPNSTLPYRVRWANGFTNVYKQHDLMVISRAANHTITKNQPII